MMNLSPMDWVLLILVALSLLVSLYQHWKMTIFVRMFKIQMQINQLNDKQIGRLERKTKDLRDLGVPKPPPMPLPMQTRQEMKELISSLGGDLE